MLILLIIVISFETIHIYSPVYHIASADKTNSHFPDDTTFDNKIQFLMYLAHMPSLSVCILKNNSIIWSNAYKHADRKNHIPAILDTIYMVASISKTFTATAILQFYEQGKINLDDDVSSAAGFPIRNPRYPNQTITFRM